MIKIKSYLHIPQLILIWFVCTLPGYAQEVKQGYLIQYPPGQYKAHIFPQIHAHLNGEVSEFIFKIYQAPDSVFWFCTNHDGIIKYDGYKFTKYSKNDGVGGNAVRDLVVDTSGTIWFGTSGGLTRFDGQVFTNFRLDSSQWDNEIWSLEIDQRGLIWVGTNTGVSQFDGSQFKTFEVPKPEIKEAQPMISKHRISHILSDHDGVLWFVNDGYGITKYDGDHFLFLTTENGLTDNNVASVFEDQQRHIWIGTYYGGVSKFDGKTYRNYTKDSIIEGVETSNFCEDQNGNIWFSAEGYGVYKFDGKVFTNYTKKNGLTNHVVQHIYEDKKGQIWFCTWQGISVYDGDSIVDISLKEPWTK